MPEPHAERVAAVFSAFQPGSQLLENCLAAAAQCSQVIVVDDGSAQAGAVVFEELEKAGITVIRQTENLGIGAAMNRGFAAGIAAEFIVTFDQDSKVPPGFIGALVSEYDRAVAAGRRVGMVSPEFFSGTSQTRMPQGEGFLEAYAPIQSGLLMPTAVIAELGAQREDYFIDLVDTEYYLRARRSGYDSLAVPGLRLPHGFGHRLYVHAFGKRLRKADGRPRMVAVSSPFRYYYRARNRVVLHREYAQRNDPKLRALLRRDARNDLLLDFAVAVWSAKGKCALMSLMCAGWRDGLRQRMGKLPARLARRAARVSWKHPAND